MKLDLNKNSSYQMQYNRHLLKRGLSSTIDIGPLHGKTEDHMSKGRQVNFGSSYKS